MSVSRRIFFILARGASYRSFALRAITTELGDALAWQSFHSFGLRLARRAA